MKRLYFLITVMCLFGLPACRDSTLIAWGNSDADTKNLTDSSCSSDDDTGTGNDSDTNTDSESDEPNICSNGLVGWASANADNVDGTTGGGTATPVAVSTLEDLVTYAADANPQVIQISGTIDTGDVVVEIGSNKTLVGVDANATITGGLEIIGNSNVIIQNLNIVGKGDGADPSIAVGIEGASHHIWVDHCDIRDAGNKNIGMIEGSDFLTVSWTRFSYTDSANTHRLSCVVGGGSNADTTDVGKINTTWHHNLFGTLVNGAMPRILFGQGHVFNNYYNSPDNAYCIGVGSYAGVLIENNYFQDVNDPHIYSDEIPSFITVSNNVYDNTTGTQDTGGDGEPFPETSPYTYQLDAVENVPAIVTQCAGPQ